MYVCMWRKKRASSSKRISMGDTYHCVSSGAFPERGHLRSSWCTVGRGTGSKSETRCPRFLRKLEQLLVASHCNSTSDGLADSAHSDTRCHRTCKEIYPLQVETQGHITAAHFGVQQHLVQCFSETALRFWIRQSDGEWWGWSWMCFHSTRLSF